MAKRPQKKKQGKQPVTPKSQSPPAALPPRPVRKRELFDQDAPSPVRRTSSQLTAPRPVRTRVEPPAQPPRQDPTRVHVDSVQQVSQARREQSKKKQKENKKRSKQLAKEQKKQQELQKKQQAQDRRKRINRVRRKRRRKRNRALYYILALIVIVAAGAILSTTVFFQIETITVEGTQRYTAEQIAQYGGVQIGDNLFRINLDQIEEQAVEGCTTLDSIQVRRSLPNTLVFICQEAEAKYGILGGDQIYILSSAGRIIDITQRLDSYPDLVLLSGPDVTGLNIGDFLEQDSFNSLTSALNAASAAGIDGIRGAAMDGVEVSLNYQDRVTIRLGNVLDLDYKFSLVSEVLFTRVGSSEAGVLDASVEGRVTFRPMPLAEQSETLNQLAAVRSQGGTITAEQAAQQQTQQPADPSTAQPETGSAPEDTASSAPEEGTASASDQESQISTDTSSDSQAPESQAADSGEDTGSPEGTGSG